MIKTINLELTNLCNASCIICPLPSSTRKRGFMSMELFNSILPEIVEINPTWGINLHLWGESLLNPNFFNITKKLRKNFSGRIGFSTNGMLLTEENINQLVDIGLNFIMVSINGIGSVHEKISVGTDYIKVKNNTLNLIEALRNTRTQVRIQFIKIDQNSHQIPDFIRYWRSKLYKKDVIFIKRFIAWAGQVPEYSSEPRGRAHPCPVMHHIMSILWDGDVSLCCLDPNKVMVIGNARDGLRNVWFGKKAKLMREREPSFCKKCKDNVWSGEEVWGIKGDFE